ncbi:MAG TPA: hypothetical protein VHV08_12815, partial [Pirellulales bacterium]|nr:hypothetical protein [Pirellulales bacterium]
MSQNISDSAAGRSAEPGWSESEKLRTLDRWTWATAVCGTMALVVLIGIAVWGVARDFADIKTTILRAEITRLRSHAARTTINIQEHLSKQPVASAADLQKLSEIKWLRRHWGNVIGLDSLRLYSAILVGDGTILVHSDPAAQGKRLTARFQPTDIAGLGDDVSEINDPTLTFGRSALDIALPILFKDHEIATYHSGLDLAAFEKVVRATQRRSMLRWSAVLAVVIAA